MGEQFKDDEIFGYLDWVYVDAAPASHGTRLEPSLIFYINSRPCQTPEQDRYLDKTRS